MSYLFIDENTGDEELKQFLIKKDVKDFLVERRKKESPPHFVRIIAENQESGCQILKLIETSDDFPHCNGLTILNWGVYDVIEFTRVDYGFDDIESYFLISFNLLKWTYDFDFEDYWIEFSRIWGLGEFTINSSSSESNNIINFEFGFIYSGKKDLLSRTIKSQSIIIEFHTQAIKSLKNKNTNSILASFDFPKELKISCEQYLLYFAQFLQDLGINATSNLKEEAGKVLFSVTPMDGIEGLDKIREALAVYLNLPSSPVIYDDSFASMRLQQQVENLQHSQRMAEREIRTSEKELRLSQTVIENQDKIIQQKDLVIEQQNRIIERISDKAVMINSAENKEELEEIFDGVKVGKSENLQKWLGLHLNPATAIKSIGKKLVGETDIIELNLDEDE